MSAARSGSTPRPTLSQAAPSTATGLGEYDAVGRTLAIACGGTGGHFYPGLSIAHAWKRRGGHVVLLVAGRHQAKQIETARQQGIDAEPADAAPRPANKLLYPVYAARLLGDIAAARRALRRAAADVVLCMGSYASAPIGLAAASRRLPLLLHDGNAHVGRANRALVRFATYLATALPPPPDDPLAGVARVVGMPVRDSLIAAAALPPLTAAERADLCRELGLQPDLPTLLAFGGSQGALVINRSLPEACRGWSAPRPFQVVHLTGADCAIDVAGTWRAAGVPAHVAAYDARIDRLYRLADLVVCRAGGSTVAELALFGKAALLIPYAAALDGHQLANARAVEAVRGGVLLGEAECVPERLRGLVASWLDTPGDFAAYGAQIRTLARPGAADAMVDLALDAIAARARRPASR